MEITEQQFIDAINHAKQEQQHRIEHLVHDHLLEVVRAQNCSTELEQVMQNIVKQFVDAVKHEEKRFKDFQSIYL